MVIEVLYRLILLSGGRNIGKRFGYFIGNTFVVMLLYLFYAINYAVTNSTGTGGYSSIVLSVVSAQSEQNLMIVALAFIVFLFFCIRSYIVMRIPEYARFLILGLPQQKAYICLLLESLLGCILSACAGLLLGICLGHPAAYLLMNKSKSIQLSVEVNLYVIKKIALTEGIALLISLTAAFVWMDLKPLKDLARMRQYIPWQRSCRKLVCLGISGLCFVMFGCIEYFSTKYIYFQQFSQLLLICGTFLACWAFINLCLARMRKKGCYRSAGLLNRNSIDLSLNHNMLLIGVLFIFSFAAFSTVMPSIVLFKNNESKDIRYRYDMIYMTRSNHIRPVMQIAERYGGTVVKIPMMRITVGNGEECIGFPCSAYKILTGKEINVQDDEADFVIEKWGRQKNQIVENDVYGTLAENMHAGRSGSKFEDTPLSVSRVKVLTGSIIGKYSPLGLYFSESTVFFSNREFYRMRNKVVGVEQEPIYFLAFHFASRKNRACQEVESYVNRHDKMQYEEDSETFYENNYYITSDARHVISMMYTQTFTVSVIMLMVLLLCTLFITLLKYSVDEKNIQNRYTFFKALGLDDITNRSNLIWEIGTPSLTGNVMGTAVMIPYIICASIIPNLLNYRQIVSGWIFLIVLYAVVQFIMIFLLRAKIR
ncbi:MAG: hypothetical protein ACI4WY_00035 [Anaerovoracaceae bacterium]